MHSLPRDFSLRNGRDVERMAGQMPRLTQIFGHVRANDLMKAMFFFVVVVVVLEKCKRHVK